MAALLALLIAVPLAFLAALRRAAWVDAAIRGFSQLSLSMPVFYIGLILLITLAAGLRWFPVGGIGSGFVEDLYYLFLPALTLALSLGDGPAAQPALLPDRGAARRVRRNSPPQRGCAAAWCSAGTCCAMPRFRW